VIIPKAHPVFAKSSLEIYAAVHDAIRRALETNEIEAALAGKAADRISESCFANPVRADVISEGRKVAGAAHRRSRAGLLHQGSIQQVDLPDRFRVDFAQALCQHAEARLLSREILNTAASLAETKYATMAWLTRR
jgi:lipoate-protein ligase A